MLAWNDIEFDALGIPQYTWGHSAFGGWVLAGGEA